MTTTDPDPRRFVFKVSETDPGLAEVTLHPRTVVTPERREALEEHIADYLVDVPVAQGYALVARAAIEHGWAGATADIAERLEAILDVDDDEGIDIDALDALVDELKREVGA